MVNSRAKGAAGERELAKLLRAEGFDARRGQQFCGANGDADVVGLPGIHMEVKRVEALRLWDALAQSKHDARPDEKPIVIHRRNNCEWVVIQPLRDWLEMYREAMPVTTVTIATDPTAEPMEVKFKPVVKGKWQPIVRGEKGYSAGDFRCSVCGEPNHCYKLTNFCQNCGADMRGED